MIEDPKKPNSSAIAQNIKSELCTGIKSPFVCVPFRNPFPKNPPEPIPIRD